MNKKIALLLGASVLTSSLYAGACSDGFKVDFTFFGAPDKSYVVTKNTFGKITSTFPEEKLLNATVEIDVMSLDTSADMNNIKAKWPPAMAKTRNMNTKNHFFKNFDKDKGKVSAKIVKVGDKDLSVAVTMNGVTKELPFTYEVAGDTLKAKGKLEILDFALEGAWKKFDRICKAAFHHGKSWSEIELFFEVPASCK